MRLAWKSFLLPWFIFILFFAGCGEPEPKLDELLLQAEQLLDAGQIENAILVLERCQELDPNRVDVLENLAFAHAANGDPILASLTFTRIAELLPDSPEYLLYSAESLLEAGEVDSAVQQYQRYLDIRPKDRAVWVALAGLQEENGRLGNALEAYLAAEQVESRPGQQIAIGNLYLRTGNLAQAQAWFARALTEPGETRDEALMGLLETAIRSKRFADAEALLRQLDAEYPGRLDGSPLDNVRDQLMAWRERQEAAEEALAALEDQGSETGSRVSRQVEEAVASVEAEPVEQQAAVPQPTQTGESAQGEREPLQPPATVPTPQLPAAEEPAAQVAQIPATPETGEYARNISEARRLKAAGQFTEAIRLYKKALVLDDGDADIWAELSASYLEVGNARWAQATASEAMRREPDNPKRTLLFLRAAQRTMEDERLLREMEDAYRRFPNTPEVILVLARAYRDRGNLRNAGLLFEKFLRIAPDNHPERALAEGELLRL